MLATRCKKKATQLVMSDNTHKKYFLGDFKETKIGTKTAEGGRKGSIIGGTVETITGVVTVIGTSFVVPEGLVFRIQIGFFKKELPEEHFDGIFPLASEQIDNTYFRYIAGSFPTYEAAKRSLQKINDKGYTDAFIVAYFNGKKISISEALSM